MLLANLGVEGMGDCGQDGNLPMLARSDSESEERNSTPKTKKLNKLSPALQGISLPLDHSRHPAPPGSSPVQGMGHNLQANLNPSGPNPSRLLAKCRNLSADLLLAHSDSRSKLLESLL